MEDYWLGVCVGWLLGMALTSWLERGRIKAYKNHISALEMVIDKLK